MSRYTDDDISALAEFRYQVRRFLRFSEQAAREAGLEPQQHQLLLAVVGSPEPPAIGAVAERLQLLPHSTDELIRRAEANGLVRRRRSKDDRRVVHVEATAAGRRALTRLADAHRTELRAAAPALVRALAAIAGTGEEQA